MEKGQRRRRVRLHTGAMVRHAGQAQRDPAASRPAMEIAGLHARRPVNGAEQQKYRVRLRSEVLCDSGASWSPECFVTCYSLSEITNEEDRHEQRRSVYRKVCPSFCRVR
jgi:hypothetical protein